MMLKQWDTHMLGGKKKERNWDPGLTLFQKLAQNGSQTYRFKKKKSVKVLEYNIEGKVPDDLGMVMSL